MRLRVLANLLDPLDPDAVVGDVQVVQYVRGLVGSEDLVDVQQALEDADLPWAHEHTRGPMEKGCYLCSVLVFRARQYTPAAGRLSVPLKARSHCSIHKSNGIRGKRQISCSVS